jgi:hypothetical protein
MNATALFLFIVVSLVVIWWLIPNTPDEWETDTAYWHSDGDDL